jgi:iron complex transport system ATP-binding protein
MDVRMDFVSVELGGTEIVHALDLEVPSGQVVGLLGPNGSGKSTALRTLYRALHPAGGTVRVGGDDLASLSLRASAQRVSALAQNGGSDLDFTVRELVALGRTRALVQEPAVLVLDEPTNHLDVRHQIQLLTLVRDMGVTAVVVLHDLNLAAAVCDRVGVLKDGRLVAAGPPREALTPELLREVFEVDAVIVDHPLTGAPQILFALGDHRAGQESTRERTTP